MKAHITGGTLIAALFAMRPRGKPVAHLAIGRSREVRAGDFAAERDREACIASLGGGVRQLGSADASAPPLHDVAGKRRFRFLERVGLARDPPRLRLPDLLWSVVLVSAGYYAAGLVALLVTFPPSGISVIWPANAILLVPLLLTPSRYWWMYLLAVIPMHLHLVVNFQQPDPPVVVALGQVASNAAYVVLAALIVRPILGVPPQFDSLRNMMAFVFGAGIAATAVACALAVLLFLLTGWATDFWLAWRQRVLAGVFPIITITPLILLACTGQLVGWQRNSPRAYAELALLLVGLIAVGVPVLGWQAPAQGNVPGLLLTPLPFLLWAAVRLGPGGLSASLSVVAGLCLATGYLGRGPFANQSSAENVLSLQIFLLATSIPLMLLAALVEERRRAVEVLKQTEAQMAVAAASTDTGLWQYDIRGRRLWATEHCRTMFALGADTLLTPEVFLDAVHPDDRAIALATFQPIARAEKTASRGEFRVVDPGGQVRWYLASASNEFDENGQPTRVSGIFRDVTLRRKAEQETALLEDALLSTREELARVSRETLAGTMAASIAHEISQPLTALIANADAALLLLQTANADPAELREIFENIVADGHRAGQIIASTRAMFRKDRREKSPVSIRDLVHEVLTLVDRQIESQRVSVRVELHQDLPPVIGDRVQLQQVLLNLVGNALEAMSSIESREPLLLIRSEHSTRDVLILVEDSGPGMGTYEMERIFEAFFTTKSHGMGLGLSISRSIIEAHGGRIWASARIPCGSIFHIRLPCGVPVRE